jgi:hypothetical protein
MEIIITLDPKSGSIETKHHPALNLIAVLGMIELAKDSLISANKAQTEKKSEIIIPKLTLST